MICNSQKRTTFDLYDRDTLKILQHQVRLALGEDFITKYGSTPLHSPPRIAKIGLQACTAVEQAVNKSVPNDVC